MGRMRTSLKERLLARLVSAPAPMSHDRLGRPLKGPCLLWTGATQQGYGVIYVTEVGNNRKVHRVMYEMSKGPATGPLDHLCRVPRCAAPEHLEEVTPLENTRRGNCHERSVTACPKGHPYDATNTRIGSKGERRCRSCDRDRSRTQKGIPLDKVVGKNRAHCVHGHEWTEENTYRPPNKPDNRICRQCIRDSQRRYQLKKKTQTK